MSFILAAPSLAKGPQGPVEGFVEVNGVRLQFLDWGGTDPALIFVHGLGDNAHVFDDLAPSFTRQFHVIAYTRRGSAGSDIKGPYDVDTLIEDLRSLMDALGVKRAVLVGHSAGGGEITEMAVKYPDRVDRIVYLDAAYDYGTVAFRTAIKAIPIAVSGPPANALASWEAFLTYQKTVWYSGLDDMARIEANLREKVVILPDRRLKERTGKEVIQELYSAFESSKPHDYAHVACPALAIYPDHLYDVHVTDQKRRSELLAYEKAVWDPFRANSVNRLRRELKGAQVARVRGAHSSFFLTDREEVVDLMRRFLSK